MLACAPHPSCCCWCCCWVGQYPCPCPCWPCHCPCASHGCCACCGCCSWLLRSCAGLPLLGAVATLVSGGRMTPARASRCALIAASVAAESVSRSSVNSTSGFSGSTASPGSCDCTMSNMLCAWGAAGGGVSAAGAFGKEVNERRCLTADTRKQSLVPRTCRRSPPR